MKTYKLGRLYFKYIRGTCMEKDGLTAQDLAVWMLSRGLIVLVGGDRWAYKTGGTFGRREILKMFYQDKNKKLP